MEKHFNIKTITLFLFTFICIFSINSNVKAMSACYYRLGDMQNILVDQQEEDFYNDKYLRFEVLNIKNSSNSTNTKYIVTIVDSSEKKYSSSYIKQKTKYPIDISVQTKYDGKQLTECPKQLYYFGNYCETDDPTMNYKGCKIYYYLSSNEILGFNDTDIGSCRNRKVCGVNERTILSGSNSSTGGTSNIPTGGTSNTPTDNSCSLENINISDSSLKCVYGRTDGTDFNSHFLYMDMNELIILCKKGDDFESISYDIDFSRSEYGNTCPKNLYLVFPEGTNAKLKIEKGYISEKDRYIQLGLLSKLEQDKSDITESKTIDCKQLGGIGTIIKSIYNIIRFLVPVLIIVYSVIEFLTVVLSGENEKMEKAKKHFIIRIIVGLLFLFIPAILELLLSIAGIVDSGNLSDIVCNMID